MSEYAYIRILRGICDNNPPALLRIADTRDQEFDAAFAQDPTMRTERGLAWYQAYTYQLRKIAEGREIPLLGPLVQLDPVGFELPMETVFPEDDKLLPRIYPDFVPYPDEIPPEDILEF